MIQTINPHYYACQTHSKTVVSIDKDLTQMMADIRAILEKYQYNSIILGVVR